MKPELLLEALLFSSHKTLSFDEIYHFLKSHYPDLTQGEVSCLIQNLKQEYSQNHAFQIQEIAGGFVLSTQAIYGEKIDPWLRPEKQDRLTPATQEVLAIIAWKQPVTRAQIESLRGVDGSSAISTLLEKGLIEVQGKKDAPGRPSLYGTTPAFLKLLGLKSLHEFRQLTQNLKETTFV